MKSFSAITNRPAPWWLSGPCRKTPALRSNASRAIPEQIKIGPLRGADEIAEQRAENKND
jgi:hypothetical protein